MNEENRHTRREKKTRHGAKQREKKGHFVAGCCSCFLFGRGFVWFSFSLIPGSTRRRNEVRRKTQAREMIQRKIRRINKRRGKKTDKSVNGLFLFLVLNELVGGESLLL